MVSEFLIHPIWLVNFWVIFFWFTQFHNRLVNYGKMPRYFMGKSMSGWFSQPNPLNVCVCCFTHEQKNMMLDSPRFPGKKKQLTKWSKSTSSYPAGFLWIKRRRLSLATNHVLVAPNIEVKWGHTYLSWIIKCLANSFTNKNAPTFNCCLHRYFTDTVRN